MALCDFWCALWRYRKTLTCACLSASVTNYLFTHTHTQLFNGLLSGTTRVGRYQKKQFTHSHPSWSSDILYHLPPFTTIHGNLFVQFTSLTVLSDNLSRSSLVFLLALDPQFHTPCISSPNHHDLFATHDRTSAAYSAAIPMLCHLYLVSLSAPYLGVYLLT